MEIIPSRTHSSDTNIHFFCPRGTSQSLLVIRGAHGINPQKCDSTNPKNYSPIICLNIDFRAHKHIELQVPSYVGPFWNNIYEQRESKSVARICLWTGQFVMSPRITSATCR